jgi:hypothetical protein
MCRTKLLTPKYIRIKVNDSTTQSKRTTPAAIKYRINQEIKLLYFKKQNLIQQLYKIHLECAKILMLCGSVHSDLMFYVILIIATLYGGPG